MSDQAPPPGALVDKSTGEYIRDAKGGYFTPATLLGFWSTAAAAMANAKADESFARPLVVAAFSNPERIKGSETIKLDGGWKLSVVKSQNVNLRSTEPEKISHEDAVKQCQQAIWDLSQTGKYAPEQCAAAQRFANALVRWKPELSMTVYDELTPLPEHSDAHRALIAQVKFIIDNVVEWKPGSPTVKLLPPKD